jgi:hypothetical protein
MGSGCVIGDAELMGELKKFNKHLAQMVGLKKQAKCDHCIIYV